jgi:Ser/Thr protein kinase RdoA (MazF antagonist)
MLMTTSSAPPDEQTLLATLRRANLVPDTAGWRVARLPGGANSRVYAVHAPSGEPTLTVRRARAGQAQLLDREAWALTTLGGRGGCYPWPAQRVGDLLVHGWVSGAIADLTSVSASARATLGRCLANLHGHPRPDYTIWPSPLQRHGTRRDLYHARLATIERYAALRGPLAARAQPLLDGLRAAPLTDASWQIARFTILHGDLSVGNLLWRGEHVTLIDWEFTRDGDPAEDLAYLLAEQPLPAAQQAQLTDAYRAAGGDPSTLARLPAYLPLVALDAALWWADHLGSADAPEVVERLERAERWLTHAPT